MKNTRTALAFERFFGVEGVFVESLVLHPGHCRAHRIGPRVRGDLIIVILAAPPLKWFKDRKGGIEAKEGG